VAFQEPFLRHSDAFHRVWSAGRTERLVREDIRDATSARIVAARNAARLLPERVGNPLSLNSMREDLGVAFETVRSWVGVLGCLLLFLQDFTVDQERGKGDSERG